MISEPFTVNCPLLHLILKLLLDLDLAALHRSTLVDASNYYENFYFLVLLSLRWTELRAGDRVAQHRARRGNKLHGPLDLRILPLKPLDITVLKSTSLTGAHERFRGCSTPGCFSPDGQNRHGKGPKSLGKPSPDGYR